MTPLVSPPPPTPPPPGAASPSSPTPVLTPRPAATPKPAASRPTGSPSLAPGALSPTPAHATGGRSKAQRWGDESPPPGKSGDGGGSPTSFLEALLWGGQATMESQGSAAAGRSIPPAAGAAAPRAAPRIILRDDGRGKARAARAPDEEGWTKMESRRGRLERTRLERRLRRPVPVDLRGKCFNCFSPSHRAASCRSRTRCFRCRGLGHRSSDCRRQLEVSRYVAPRALRLVWRPKASLDGTATPPVHASGANDGPGTVAPPAQASCVYDESGGALGRKRRRHRTRSRKKKGRTSAGQDEEASDDGYPNPVPPSEEGSADAEVVCVRPRRILDRSSSISQKEERLSRALIITVLAGSPNSILGSIANRFEVEVSLLSLQRFGDARYLLILPSAELTERIFNGGRPLFITPLRLHVMRWSRFVGSAASSMLDLPVEVDIRGIPAHAWELPTAELLLSDHCWIGRVHPENPDHRDVFRVLAWCSHPARIPSAMDLEILEPTMEEDGQGAGVRSLVYPITISCALVELPSRPGDPPSPPPTDDGWRHHERWHGGSPPPPSTSRAPTRVSAHARLGPRVGVAGNEEPRDHVDPPSVPPPGDASVSVGIHERAASPTSETTWPLATPPCGCMASEEAWALDSSQIADGPSAIGLDTAVARQEEMEMQVAMGPLLVADVPATCAISARSSPTSILRRRWGPDGVPISYSRRRTKALVLPQRPGAEAAPSPVEPPLPLTPAEEFISKLSKTPGGLLPFPTINKRRKKSQYPSSEAPRRSSRVAKIKEAKAAKAAQSEVCPPHLLKNVMRALDMDVPEGLPDRMQLDQSIIDEYARRFRQPHSGQVSALAALFGLIPPENFGVESDGCAV